MMDGGDDGNKFHGVLHYYGIAIRVLHIIMQPSAMNSLVRWSHTSRRLEAMFPNKKAIDSYPSHKFLCFVTRGANPFSRPPPVTSFNPRIYSTHSLSILPFLPTTWPPLLLPWLISPAVCVDRIALPLLPSDPLFALHCTGFLVGFFHDGTFHEWDTPQPGLPIRTRTQ